MLALPCALLGALHPSLVAPRATTASLVVPYRMPPSLLGCCAPQHYHGQREVVVLSPLCTPQGRPQDEALGSHPCRRAYSPQPLIGRSHQPPHLSPVCGHPQVEASFIPALLSCNPVASLSAAYCGAVAAPSLPPEQPLCCCGVGRGWLWSPTPSRAYGGATCGLVASVPRDAPMPSCSPPKGGYHCQAGGGRSLAMTRPF